MQKFRSIDLFAGIGGIRLGFDQAFGKDIETVFVSEWDEYAQKTYRANFHDDFEIAGDITKIDENDIPDFDICLAGFPCQAFSLAGQRKGFADDYKGMSRGTLFFDVARICEKKQPKVIFCENVKGLTIHDKGRTFDMDDIKCDYSKMVINCARRRFKDIMLCEQGVIDEREMNHYFKYEFRGNYVEYATEIINGLTKRLTTSEN